MPSVIAVMNLATLSRTAPTRFLNNKHHANMEDLIQGIYTPTTGETDHTPIMVPDIGEITADHSPGPILNVTEAADLEGTPHALLPATTSTCAAPQPIGAPLPFMPDTQRYNCTLFHVCHSFQKHHSCYLMDHSHSYSSSFHHKAQDSQPRKMKQCPRPSTSHKLYCPKLSPSRNLL